MVSAALCRRLLCLGEPARGRPHITRPLPSQGVRMFNAPELINGRFQRDPGPVRRINAAGVLHRARAVGRFVLEGPLSTAQETCSHDIPCRRFSGSDAGHWELNRESMVSRRASDYKYGRIFIRLQDGSCPGRKPGRAPLIARYNAEHSGSKTGSSPRKGSLFTTRTTGLQDPTGGLPLREAARTA